MGFALSPTPKRGMRFEAGHAEKQKGGLTWAAAPPCWGSNAVRYVVLKRRTRLFGLDYRPTMFAYGYAGGTWNDLQIRQSSSAMPRAKSGRLHVQAPKFLWLQKLCWVASSLAGCQNKRGCGALLHASP